MVFRLAKLTDSEIPKIANDWGNTEEIKRFSGWKPDVLESFLREISALSRSAIADGKSVLMWMCL
jgi:hypothetical protein